MGRSRTQNVSTNIIIALFCQLVNLLMAFLARTFFIKVLGIEYLGVNGLFTNILTILSFAELGIGNAIVFSMYKPLAVKDEEKLASLMLLYKQAYQCIGMMVAIVGLCITPFLKYIIKEAPDISENISVLYLLFLLNTAASYFFAYKKSIIIADQKNYIVLLVTEGVHITQTVIQIMVLLLTHNFILYLAIQIVCTFLDNFIAGRAADRIYPFLHEKKAIPLSQEEAVGIFKNVRALALYKFGSVILNGTDNILISTMLGVTEVGLASNYVLVINAANKILNKITDSFTASVGNLNAVDQEKKQYDVFRKMFLITVWIYGYVSIGLLTVFNSFIEVWLGRDYLLDIQVAAAIVSEFFVKGVHSVSYTYRTTKGYFVQGKYSAIVAALINFVLSIVLCRLFGLAGIFIATPIARILSTGIVDPVLIYRNSFHKNPVYYYLDYMKYVALFIAIGLFCKWLLVFVTVSGWLGVIIQIIVVTIVFNGIMLAVFAPTKIFKELVKSVFFLIKKKI